MTTPQPDEALTNTLTSGRAGVEPDGSEVQGDVYRTPVETQGTVPTPSGAVDDALVAHPLGGRDDAAELWAEHDRLVARGVRCKACEAEAAIEQRGYDRGKADALSDAADVRALEAADWDEVEARIGDLKLGLSDLAARAVLAAVGPGIEQRGYDRAVARVAEWANDYFGCIGMPGQCGHTEHYEETVRLRAALACRRDEP